MRARILHQLFPDKEVCMDGGVDSGVVCCIESDVRMPVVEVGHRGDRQMRCPSSKG